MLGLGTDQAIAANECGVIGAGPGPVTISCGEPGPLRSEITYPNTENR